MTERRELSALQLEFAHLERKYLQSKRSLNQILQPNNNNNINNSENNNNNSRQQQHRRPSGLATKANGNNTNTIQAASTNSSDSLDDNDGHDDDDDDDQQEEEGDEDARHDHRRDQELYDDQELDEEELDRRHHHLGRVAGSGGGDNEGGVAQTSRRFSSAAAAATCVKQRGQAVWPQQANNILGQSRLSNQQQQPFSSVRSLPMPLSGPQLATCPAYLVAGGAAATNQRRRQQQQQRQTAQRAPMSLEERLKFSSSTPPSGLHSTISNSANAANHRAATHLAQAAVRRRLPCQPLEIQQQQQQATNSGHQTTDSQSTYQQPQQPQIRAATVQTAAEPLETRMGAVSLLAGGNPVDNDGSINDGHRSSGLLFSSETAAAATAAASATGAPRFEPMNMLMKDRLLLLGQQQPTLAAAASRYHQQQQQRPLSGFAYAASETQQLDREGGYFCQVRQQNLAQSNQQPPHDRYGAADQLPLYVAASAGRPLLATNSVHGLSQPLEYAHQQPIDFSGSSPPPLEAAAAAARGHQRKDSQNIGDFFASDTNKRLLAAAAAAADESDYRLALDLRSAANSRAIDANNNNVDLYTPPMDPRHFVGGGGGQHRPSY